MASTPTNLYDVTQPPDTEQANLLGRNLRDLALNVQQRMGFISGSLAARWNPGADIQPANWTGLLYFSTDTQQIFRWNGSAWYDVTSAFPTTVIAKLDYPPSGGSMAPGTFFTTTRAGMYRITFDIIITTPANNGTVLATVGWNNGTSALTAQTSPLNATVLGNEIVNGTITFYAPAGTNIIVSTTFAGAAGALQHVLRVRLEYLS